MELKEAETIITEDNIPDQPELIVGIPSLNEEDTIAEVAQHIAGGISKYYPNRSTVIVNVDNASTDNTRENFLDANTGDCKKAYISTEPGKKGKGRNFYNLFEYASKVNPEALVVQDADLTSSRPEWIVKFLHPILEGGCDYVTPIYKRHPYDGTITNNLCYPITYALNKYNVRQPIGGDFAFSGEMASYWLEENWYDCTLQYGIDIFMTTTSIYKGEKIGCTHLGRKAHKPSAPNLLPMFQEVCESLFNILRDDRAEWENLSEETREPERYFPPVGDSSFPELSVDTESIAHRIENTYEDYSQNMELFLPDELLNRARKMIDTGDYQLDSQMWVDVLVNAISSYLDDSDKKIITGLLPLYFLRQISFIRETRDLPPQECEERFEKQAKLLKERLTEEGLIG